MDNCKKLYIFIAEISSMLNMGQDTKTRSDNGTDGCSDESHKLRRREAQCLAPSPGDNILFIPNSPLRPVTNTTRASLASKISRIFTFTRAPKLKKTRPEMQNGLVQLSLFRQFSAPEVWCAEEFCKMFLGNKVK